MTQPKTIETLDVEPPIGAGWDERYCGACGDEIEPNMESVERHFDVGFEHKMVDDCHTWCAVKEGSRLRWSAVDVLEERP